MEIPLTVSLVLPLVVLGRICAKLKTKKILVLDFLLAAFCVLKLYDVEQSEPLIYKCTPLLFCFCFIFTYSTSYLMRKAIDHSSLIYGGFCFQAYGAEHCRELLGTVYASSITTELSTESDVSMVDLSE